MKLRIRNNGTKPVKVSTDEEPVIIQPGSAADVESETAEIKDYVESGPSRG